MDELARYLKQRGISQAAFGEMLSPTATQGAISQWLVNERVPAERVPEVSRLTGIPMHKLRPDLFKANDAA